MKAFGIAVVILLALFVADQLFTQGKYTEATERMAQQIRHSTGI